MTLYTQNKTLSTAQVLARGWTAHLLAVLHPPHIFRGGQKTYFRKDIVKLEKTPTWQKARKEAKEQAKKSNQDLFEVIATANIIPIQIKEVDDVLTVGEEYHAMLSSAHGREPFNNETVTDQMRARWAVNCLRHSVAGYDKFRENKEKFLLGKCLYGAVKIRILMAIRKRYPVLADECDLQIESTIKAIPQLREPYLTKAIKEPE